MALTRTTDWARDVRSVLVVLERSRGQLRQAEQLVADYALAHPGVVVNSSITDLARLVGTSGATVLRMCRSLEYGGFPDFKLALARDLARADQDGDQTEALALDDTADRVAYLAFRQLLQSLDETMELQQATQLELAVSTLTEAPAVLVTASASRANLAAEAHRRLLQLGVHASLILPQVASELLVMGTPGAAVFAFADAAVDPWLADVLQFAPRGGFRTVLCTAQMGDPLEGLADVVLHAAWRPYRAGELELDSLAAELSILEAVVFACALRNYDHSVATARARSAYDHRDRT